MIFVCFLVLFVLFCFVLFCFRWDLHIYVCGEEGVPRLGVELELQLLAYTTATATQDPSRICDLHHSSWQCQTPNPLSEARDWTCTLMDTSQARYHWATMGTSPFRDFEDSVLCHINFPGFPPPQTLANAWEMVGVLHPWRMSWWCLESWWWQWWGYGGWGCKEGDGSSDGNWPRNRSPGSLPLAFIFQFHSKQSCCCFGREIKMPGRYRQPSTIALLSPAQLSSPFFPSTNGMLYEKIQSTALDRNIEGSLARTSLRREHNVAIIYCIWYFHFQSYFSRHYFIGWSLNTDGKDSGFVIREGLRRASLLLCVCMG